MNTLVNDIARQIARVRKTVPLVHQITNYVTVNDCANITLAIGASPIMADDLGEVENIVSIASALVINIGTLNERTLRSMITAGRCANARGVPVVFDPVGVGASSLRNRAVAEIFENVRVSILRGNLSEISFALGLSSSTRGVDSSSADEKNDPFFVARETAKKFGITVAVTGKTDFVSDGARTFAIQNGHPMLSRVTGTGCMTTALVGAFAGSQKDDMLFAAAAGVCCMGICGETAHAAAGDKGLGSFRAALIDAVSNFDENTFAERAKIDVR